MWPGREIKGTPFGYATPARILPFESLFLGIVWQDHWFPCDRAPCDKVPSQVVFYPDQFQDLPHRPGPTILPPQYPGTRRDCPLKMGVKLTPSHGMMGRPRY